MMPLCLSGSFNSPANAMGALSREEHNYMISQYSVATQVIWVMIQLFAWTINDSQMKSIIGNL